MASVAPGWAQDYARLTMRAHYDPDVDIVLIVFEPGQAVSEEHDWGLINRDPEDSHVMGFEIWDASKRLPSELLCALPS
jgi:uncharacterized protein YuzE